MVMTSGALKVIGQARCLLLIMVAFFNAGKVVGGDSETGEKEEEKIELLDQKKVH